MQIKVTIVILISAALLSCSDDVTHDVRKTSQEFLVAYTTGDYFEAEDHIVPESKYEWRKYIHDVSLNEHEYFIKDIKVMPEENVAHVKYYLTGVSDPQHLYMVRVDDRWMIEFERKDPMGVAEKFLKAFNAGDIETAKSFSSPNAQRDLEHMKSNFDQWSANNVKITSVRYNKDNDKAIVYYVEEGKEELMKIYLRKIEGEWKVTFTKQEEWEFKEGITQK